MKQIFTGAMRPRHHRFASGLERLDSRRELVLPTTMSRVKMRLTQKLSGIRKLSLKQDDKPTVLHQALSDSDQPYFAEFDVPMGVHSYHVPAYLECAKEAKALMLRETCRGIFVFSEWAKRSFALHYGEEVAQKCHVLYPLASKKAHGTPAKERRYDFTFIATQFAIKCGPQLVEAFSWIAREFPEARLCIVTRLSEAKQYIEEYRALENLEWREANLDEQQIADLLSHTRTLVHPSLVDSFGVVVLEALAAGCALITTDIASFPEMCRPGENGALINPPFAGVVGANFITEYGTISYVNRLLEQMDLSAMTHAIHHCMQQFLEHPDKQRVCMQKSEAIYKADFMHEVWHTKMDALL